MALTLIEQFRLSVASGNLFTPADRLILAVSGGVDSVVLCELCKQAGYEFMIAHCNFQLRGEESARDEAFVRQLGKKYQAAVVVKKFDTKEYAAERKVSIQEAARDLRYAWFFQLWREQLFEPGGQENGASATVPGWHVPVTGTFVLTAHHADDNAETVLMNFCRGTGLHGLTGIPAVGPTEMLGYVRRPLLPFSKDTLVQFAKEHDLLFVEDSSNLSSKYTRNLFRHEIIPAIGKVFPQVKENLSDNITRFKEIEKLYQFAVGEIKKKICRQKGDEIHIPVKQLMGYDNRALIYEIISGYGFTEKQIDEVIKLSGSESGRYIDSVQSNYRIIRHGHWFIIAPVMPQLAENIIIEKDDRSIHFSLGKLLVEETGNRKPENREEVACFDAGAIRFPLLLRKWKAGDYFYPLGMKKKKKLARFFIDQKLSKTRKEKAWVIEMNKKIIWVVGMRIDDRFKITDSTERVLQLTLQSQDAGISGNNQE